jgi:small conductance mechanosensitive channel
MTDVGTTVARGLFATLERLVAGFGGHLPLFAAAALILLVAWWLGRVAFSVTRRILARTSTAGHVDLLVARYAKAAVIAVGVVVALSVVGVNLGALVASLGLVGLTISLALKDVLANYVSGVMLLLQGPFKVGDTIIVDGVEGTVIDITARSTALRAGDARVVHVPNMTMFAATVTNVTAESVRRFEVSPDPAADAQVAAVGAAWARIIAHGWVDTHVCSLGDVQAAALIVANRRLHEAGLVAAPRSPA